MLLIGYAMLVIAGLLFFAKSFQYKGHPFADDVCYFSFGLCDSASWLAIMAALFALAIVARNTAGHGPAH
jgi:thiamine transporter ThiT